MKNFKLLGAVLAFAFLMSLNVSVFVESNDWQPGTELAEAQNPVPLAEGWGLRETTYNCQDGTLAIGCLSWGIYCRRVRCN